MTAHKQSGVILFTAVACGGLSTLQAPRSRDVIFTTAFGLQFRKVAVFFRSLAATGYQGKIIVFASNLSSAQRQSYLKATSEVIYQGVHLHRVLRRPLQMLFWRFVRHWPDAGSFSPPWDRLQQANILRWSLYRRYLEQHRTEFDRVLLVDLRDVFFQRNPFVNCDRSRLRVFAEEENAAVGETRWNTDSMRRAFGSSILKKIRTKRVTCSGVLLGGIEPVCRYLHDFSRLLPALETPDHGTDQSAHIRIVHESTKNVDFLGNREAEVCHLHHVKDISAFPRDSAGNLLNAAGHPFSIVHQYDRHPGLAEDVRRAYGH